MHIKWKAFIDSETLWTEAYFQSIIPHIACCYKKINNINGKTLNSFPFFSLNNFPKWLSIVLNWR